MLNLMCAVTHERMRGLSTDRHCVSLPLQEVQVEKHIWGNYFVCAYKVCSLRYHVRRKP